MYLVRKISESSAFELSFGSKLQIFFIEDNIFAYLNCFPKHLCKRRKKTEEVVLLKDNQREHTS